MARFRRSTLLSILAVAPALSYAAGPDQVPVIDLTRAEDIQAASAMDKAITDLSDKVAECVQGNVAPPSECFCRHPDQLSRVKKLYDETTKQHPDWKNKAVSYTMNRKTYAVSFAGLSRQLEVKCPGKT